MEQFSVPQFIETEAKIVGFITARQFLIMAAGGLIGFIFYSVADFTLFLVLAIIDLIIIILFAFVKVNGVPMHFFFLNVLQTMRKPSLRVWSKYLTTADIKAHRLKPMEEKRVEQVRVSRQTKHSTIADLALIVDTGGAYKGGKVL